MAIIKSGASTDQWTIDVTSKGGRVTPYDTLGNNRGAKATYRAATTAPFAAAAGAVSFFLIYGSGTKTIIVQRLRVDGLTLTNVEYLGIVCEKWSTAASGGTATALTQVPVDSTSAAGTANLCSVYTAAPTEGSLVGTVAARRILGEATTAAAAGIPYFAEFEFRNVGGETTGIYLRGTGQGLGLAFAAAPATAVTMSLEVEWTEE